MSRGELPSFILIDLSYWRIGFSGGLLANEHRPVSGLTLCLLRHTVCLLQLSTKPLFINHIRLAAYLLHPHRVDDEEAQSRWNLYSPPSRLLQGCHFRWRWHCW